MITKLIKYIELAFISATILLFVILAFKGPQFTDFENSYINESFKSAESVNYLFRTTLFLILPIILIWRLARPNKALRVLSLIIGFLALIIFILDVNGFLDYYDILEIRKF